MGIKLAEIVPRRKLDFDDLKNKKIAVDSSNMLFQFISSIRQPDGMPLMDSKGRVTSHLMGIFSRVSNLMQKDIKLAFVFDGQPPALKHATQEERYALKERALLKLEEARDDEDIDAQLKYSKQSTRLTPEMLEQAKELLTAMGLPVVQAPGEAEAQAAYFCRKNQVYAVASSDFDNLVYGAPRLIQRLTLSDKRKTSSGIVYVTPEIIHLEDVLKELDITQEQLLYLSILVGTDYNPGGVKGIGPKKALALVKKHKNPDELFESVPCDFDWNDIAAAFTEMPVIDVNLEWKPVDKKRVYEMLVDEFEFSAERVNATLEKLTKRNSGQKSLGDF